MIFINRGGEDLLQMALNQTEEYSVFKYMHAVESMIIGFFLLLAECHSPLFIANVNIIYRPTARSILILVFTIFLYTGQDNKLDFYLAIGIGFFMLILSFYVKNQRAALLEA